MKCLLLLTLVAFCYSYPYGWYSNVNQDGSISTTTPDGRRITLSRGLGQNNDVVVVTEYQKYGRNPWYQSDSLDQQRFREAVQAVKERKSLNDYVNQDRNWRYQESSFRNPFQREENLSDEQDREYPYEQRYVNENGYAMYVRDQDVFRQQPGRDIFNDYRRQSIRDQLSQVVEEEREILDRQDQIQQQQLRQQRQQQRLFEQQQEQEQGQREQQMQQRYLQEVQKQVLREQEQVLGEQQKVAQEQQIQLQQERYNSVRNLMGGARGFVPSKDQPAGFWQRRPSVYSQELYGGYGRGNIPFHF